MFAQMPPSGSTYCLAPASKLPGTLLSHPSTSPNDVAPHLKTSTGSPLLTEPVPNV